MKSHKILLSTCFFLGVFFTGGLNAKPDTRATYIPVENIYETRELNLFQRIRSEPNSNRRVIKKHYVVPAKMFQTLKSNLKAKGKGVYCDDGAPLGSFYHTRLVIYLEFNDKKQLVYRITESKPFDGYKQLETIPLNEDALAWGLFALGYGVDDGGSFQDRRIVISQKGYKYRLELKQSVYAADGFVDKVFGQIPESYDEETDNFTSYSKPTLIAIGPNGRNIYCREDFSTYKGKSPYTAIDDTYLPKE